MKFDSHSVDHKSHVLHFFVIQVQRHSIEPANMLHKSHGPQGVIPKHKQVQIFDQLYIRGCCKNASRTMFRALGSLFKRPRLMWKCDKCEKLFDTCEQATQHENACEQKEEVAQEEPKQEEVAQEEEVQEEVESEEIREVRSILVTFIPSPPENIVTAPVLQAHAIPEGEPTRRCPSPSREV